MYQSPIEIIQGQLMTEYENGILRAVQNYDIHCNKEELTKALMYDRNQYEKGYKDRDAEIIRCKDCKYFAKDIFKDVITKQFYGGCDYWCDDGDYGLVKDENGYCAWAERKTDRDCDNCVHHTDNGCTKWDCEFERRTDD